uniref:Uncharacterized protein n=1 Tax=Aotus nancymaae TaxID=37293 RepID=A0A2K5DYX6_AOTNA
MSLTRETLVQGHRWNPCWFFFCFLTAWPHRQSQSQDHRTDVGILLRIPGRDAQEQEVSGKSWRGGGSRKRPQNFGCEPLGLLASCVCLDLPKAFGLLGRQLLGSQTDYWAAQHVRQIQTAPQRLWKLNGHRNHSAQRAVRNFPSRACMG